MEENTENKTETPNNSDQTSATNDANVSNKANEAVDAIKNKLAGIDKEKLINDLKNLPETLKNLKKEDIIAHKKEVAIGAVVVLFILWFVFWLLRLIACSPSVPAVPTQVIPPQTQTAPSTPPATVTPQPTATPAPAVTPAPQTQTTQSTSTAKPAPAAEPAKSATPVQAAKPAEPPSFPNPVKIDPASIEGYPVNVELAK